MAGFELTSIVQTAGVCVPNSQQAEPPTYLCQSNGEWNVLRGGCVCEPGFEPHNQACKQCPVGHFKVSREQGLFGGLITGFIVSWVLLIGCFVGSLCRGLVYWFVHSFV